MPKYPSNYNDTNSLTYTNPQGKVVREVAYECILSEALASVVSSTQIFANCPANTSMVQLTVRGGVLHVRFDGVAATATNANDIAQGTVEWKMTKTDLLKIYAISSNVTSGFISYFKEKQI